MHKDKYRHERVEQGLCYSCGKKSKGFYRCRSCRDLVNENRRVNYISKGKQK